jgi:DNA-binding CsgD family transcriptional regulator
MRLGAERRLPVHGEREFVALLDLAYEAATDRGRWPALMRGLASTLGCEVVGMNLQDLRGGRARLECQIGADPSWLERYESYYAPRNIFVQARPDLTYSGAIRNGEAIVPDREAMRTEYFNDFLRPLGILHAIGMVPFRTGSVMALLSLMRPIGAPSFASADFALLERFMPHLQRALSIHRHLHRVDLARVAAAEALDAMPVGVAVLDRQGRALFYNRSFRSLVDRGDGLALLRDGIAVADPATARTFRQLVAGACATGARAGIEAGGVLQVPRSSGARPLTLVVAPLRLEGWALSPGDPAAIVFAGDPDRHPESARDTLRRLFGLTPAEAEVATLLLSGARTDELADRLGITLLTARTHVKRVLGKVGARTQAELVRVLLNGPAALRFDRP